jgi:PAS domain S-box-containing protein
MALVASDGRFLRVNQSLCAIVGYAEQELLATTFQAISHPEDLQLNLAYVRQLLAGEIATYQMEKRYIHKDESLVWVLLSVSLVRDASGAPLYFVSQVVDITSRKQAEEMLQANEERFRSLSAASPIGIFQNDANGKTVYVNQRWMEIAGRTLEESLGDEWMKGIPPGERESVLAAWKACARAGGEFSRQFRLVRPSGEVCWVHSRARVNALKV